MVNPIPTSTTSAFVIYFWKEWSSTGAYWRGWIKHVQSGQRVAFQDEMNMMRFIHSFGVTCIHDIQSEKMSQENQ